MCRDWWYSPMMKRILGALKYYADIFDEGIKIDSFLEDAKSYMSQGEIFFNISIKIKKRNIFRKKASRFSS